MRQREHEIGSIISEYLQAHPDGKLAVFLGATHINKQPVHVLYSWNFQFQEGGTIHDSSYPLFTYAAAELSKRYSVLSVDLSAGLLRLVEEDAKVNFVVSPACLVEGTTTKP